MAGQVKHYIHLHFVVLIWGFTAILGLFITIPAVEIVLYRTLLATVALAVLLLLWRKPLQLENRAMIQIMLTGCLIGAHWILFFGSARVSTASVCLAGMATSSLWTSFIEPFFYRKKIKLYEVGLGLMVIFGLYLIFSFEFNHALGLIMAVASAFLASLFTVINSKFTKQYYHYTITFYEMGGAFLFTLLFLPFYSKYISEGGLVYWQPTAMDWVYLTVLALLCTVYAYSASVGLMKNVSAYAVNLTTNMEPVYGILLALILLGDKEQMTPGFYAGTGIILASVIAYPIIRRYQRRKSAKAELSHS
ncbi:drug/metabolite transporter (DMT)-like permease [Catalinimonas alkaloidigena]|uniref:DMT family transporter n=1 Tax=Catalinimonas alkaloidigena TaxID=1075417 RepID=UPI002404F4E4|nr:DMT family transporter [Catalinimonas alkaloidigena]MDF9796716.1 drug/metabolite transporter (DMT)-like permease [Catalinimonas alkaloidigena]